MMLKFQSNKNSFNTIDLNCRTLSIILAHADIEIPFGDGLVGLRVSPKIANNQLIRETIGNYIDDISKFIVIWNEFTSSVVTITKAKINPKSEYRTLH